MQALLTSPMRWQSLSEQESLFQIITGRSQQAISTASRQSMMHRHTCLCCSYPLLRHMRLGELYWRCSHCHQEMPV